MTEPHRELLIQCLSGFLIGALITRVWLWAERLMGWWDKRK